MDRKEVIMASYSGPVGRGRSCCAVDSAILNPLFSDNPLSILYSDQDSVNHSVGLV